MSLSMFERFSRHAAFMPKGQESYAPTHKMNYNWLKHASLHLVPKQFLVGRPRPTAEQKVATPRVPVRHAALSFPAPYVH